MKINKTISLILLMGGASNRFDSTTNKVLWEINQLPLYLYSLNTFDKLKSIKLDQIILVIRPSDEEQIKARLDNTTYQDKVIYVYGGNTRVESVKNGLKLVNTDYVLIHDAARACVNFNDVDNLINQTLQDDYLLSYLGSKCVNTLRKHDGEEITTIDRNNLYVVSTPQMFKKDLYQLILNNLNNEITDEVSLFTNQKVLVVEEKYPNPKLTYPKDLDYIKYLLTNNKEYLIGESFDFHPFSNMDKLRLGGITFDNYPKLQAWSDGDCLYHAVAESIMGALSIGDLGTFFPDTDEKNHHLDSKEILLFVKKELDKQNTKIQNIDITLYLEEPKLKNYKILMARNIEQILDCQNVCVKACTLNDLLSKNQIKGIGARSIVLLYQTR